MSLFKDFSFAGKKALIRVDFNVPLNDAFEITDDNRMRATIPTITKILKEGGSVILMSHLGRPKDGPTEKYSLKHIVKHLSELLGGVHVGFANDDGTRRLHALSHDAVFGGHGVFKHNTAKGRWKPKSMSGVFDRLRYAVQPPP